ncbi:MAG: F0F1 ATP synthase subunit B [candidate division Zixibacteria bacterium]|nr:F0F1 ATP synthase subunit B [candidate division Zixibacteria bacterium]
MTFDIQQFLTHLVGFLITLWILKKFAWGPLLALMEERRNKIVDEFKSIDDEKAKVALQQVEYDSRLKEIENERRAKLVEAVDEGKRVAADMKATAQTEAKEIGSKAKAELEREVAKAKVQLKNDMVAITMRATEKVIKEKLDETKQRDLIGRFIDDLQKV